ncbi:MAG: DUF3418 domain-containing protein, partial [Actinobacteria bacterium]|nr:DUF3418 domain-containing protein [Actinomycetota bacterium]
KELGSSAFRRLCRSEHLNYVRVREWFDVHRQLRTLVKTGRDGAADTADPDAVHRALLAGLLSHIGVLDERASRASVPERAKRDEGRAAKRRIAEYRGARGIRFSLFPGSALRPSRASGTRQSGAASPRAVMAAEIVETSRTFARTAAAIDPAWAEALAGDLAKRQISEPHWSKEAGAAVAFEKVTLFGVEIVARRRVQFARIDRPAARELFLRHALVEGEWDPSRIDKRVSAFWRSNAELRRRLEKLEERERRRDILVGDEAVFRFYDERIPAEVFDVRSFEAWWRDALAATPKLLVMREGDLIDDDERADQQDFPTRWTQADQVLGLAYRFDPGAADDGVSVVIPLALLQQVRDAGFDWQVPGLRAELVTALLRALPKAIRRHVVPAADWAETFGAQLSADGPESHAGLPTRSLREALARLVQPLANQPMSAADFDMERVPGHLRMNFRAVDERGRVAGSGRDLVALQRELADRSRASVARTIERGPEPARPGRGRGAAAVAAAPTAAPAARDGLTTWDLGDLPEVLDTRVAGGVVRGYPALVDQGRTVSLRVEATAEAARTATRGGVLRLVLLGIPSPASYVQDHLTSAEKLALAASPYPNVAALIEDARTAVARAAIDRLTGGSTGAGSVGIVRTEAEFARVRDGVSAIVVDELFALVSLVAKILTTAREVERALKGQNSLALLGPLNDVRGQLAGLLPNGFIAHAGAERLAHYPRYLEGILDRLRTIADAPGRDRTRLTEYERMAQQYADAGGAIPLPADAAPGLVEVRWLLEEYRVSLFAQRLGTAQPVSPQRIVKALAER